MKHIRTFALGCLFFGSFISLPFGLKAEKTEVTFDAKDYQSGKDWKKFIEALCKTLKEHPDYEKTDDTFRVNIQNGAVLGTDPQPLSNYFKNYAEYRQIGDVLSKISFLKADTGRFSLLSLKRIFTDATEIHLNNTETVTDSLEGCMRKLNLVFYRSFTLENNLTWPQFIEHLRDKLGKYPDDNRVRFYLEFNNSDIFAQDPGNINYGAYLDPEKKPTEIAKILSKVSRLSVDAKHFSTLSLSKVFPWTKVLFLPNAERIYGSCDSVDLELKASDWNAVQTMWKAYQKCAPHLKVVRAPRVTRIGNAAFFGFGDLRYFNAFHGSGCPTIACTSLPQDYFNQEKSPTNTRIAPVTVKAIEVPLRKKTGETKISHKYGGKSVEIGACAFQLCLSLQHVSAHASFIGSAAFSASGLKSAHLLLSENAPVGDDVFFNCFGLKECFMMLGRTDYGTVNSFLNGTFWNCFALKTVCIPNIRYPHFNQALGEHRKIDNPPATYNGDSLTMFMNCFSLQELDLRHFEKRYNQFLPYWIIRSNHELIAGKEIEDWKSYVSSYFASILEVPEDTDRPGRIGEYVKLCRSEPTKPFELLQAPGRRSDVKKYVYEKPYCDIRVVVNNHNHESAKSGLDKKRLSTWIKAPVFSHSPGKVLYDPFFFPTSPAFQRFNDAYLQWFVAEDENNKDKPKNEMLNKKTKRTDFKLHGG